MNQKMYEEPLKPIVCDENVYILFVPSPKIKGTMIRKFSVERQEGK